MKTTKEPMLDNLKLCVIERTATAATFESAIKEQGLTMELIALIAQYYKVDIQMCEREHNNAIAYVHLEGRGVRE